MFSPFTRIDGADTILSGAELIYVLHRPRLILTWTSWKLLSSSTQADPVAKSSPCGRDSPVLGWETIADLAKSTTPTSSPTKCMSISSTHPTPTPTLPACPVCGAHYLPARRCPKTYPSPAGGWAYTIAPAEITDRIKKVHDFFDRRAPPRPCRRPSPRPAFWPGLLR